MRSTNCLLVSMNVETHDIRANLKPHGALLDGNLPSHLVSMECQSIKMAQSVNDG